MGLFLLQMPQSCVCPGRGGGGSGAEGPRPEHPDGFGPGDPAWTSLDPRRRAGGCGFNSDEGDDGQEQVLEGLSETWLVPGPWKCPPAAAVRPPAGPLQGHTVALLLLRPEPPEEQQGHHSGVPVPGELR